MLRQTFSRPVSLGINTHLGLTTRSLLLVWHLRSCSSGAPSLMRGSVCLFMCCWPSPAQSFSGTIPLGLETIFYCLAFEISFSSPPTTLRVTVEIFDPASTRVILYADSESYVTTDGQPASLSWSKAPIWGLRPDLHYLCESYALAFVGRPVWREIGSVLSWVRIPCDLRLYFTVSHLRILFSSPPTARRVTLEVFDPASTRISLLPSQSQSPCYVTSHDQPASLSWKKASIWDLRPDLDYCLTVAGLLIFRHPLWRQDGWVVRNCYRSSPA
jgi:hypothetical protein